MYSLLCNDQCVRVMLKPTRQGLKQIPKSRRPRVVLLSAPGCDARQSKSVEGFQRSSRLSVPEHGVRRGIGVVGAAGSWAFCHCFSYIRRWLFFLWRVRGLWWGHVRWRSPASFRRLTSSSLRVNSHYYIIASLLSFFFAWLLFGLLSWLVGRILLLFGFRSS